MDTSEKYIKMCQEAKEIQENWTPKPLDIFWNTFKINIDYGKQYSVGYPEDYNEPFTKEDDYIWLPRQDQLQEMIIGKGHLKSGVLVMLSLFTDEYGYNDYSFEQLWLAFVMHEKYGKAWNNETWIKEQEENDIP